MHMALQRCLSGGRKVILTDLLLGNSTTQLRHLFLTGLPERTRRWNNESNSNLTNIHPRNIVSSNAKWQCLKSLGRNYSKITKDRDYLKSSEMEDDDTDGDDSDKSGDYDNKYINILKLNSQVDDIFNHKTEMTSSQWEEAIALMSRANHFLTARSCDAIIMKRCHRALNYTLATSYMEHLQREGREPNLSTLGTYLQHCGEEVDKCGEDRVLELYYKLIKQVKVLDLRLSKNVIMALTSTREWRTALDHLPHYNTMANTHQDVYSALTTAAFRAGEYEAGWEFFVALRQKQEFPHDTVFLEWLRQCNGVESKAEKEAMAFTLLQNLEEQDVCPSVEVVKAITKLFKESLGWSAHFSKMFKSGVCPACKHKLSIKTVSEEEFKPLQEEFVQQVLVGSDIFRSTSPKEWRDFQAFVEKNKPFSVVIDGLNASYIQGNKNAILRSKSLGGVVEQASINHPKGHVLVLGREHMKKWFNKMLWNNYRVTIYTINNMSKDDGFFLYAALQSGLGTKFVTSDMLRDHMFRMGKGHMRDIFRRWQKTHQVMAYSSADNVHLLYPAKFSTVAQTSQADGVDVWHVPYDDGAPRQSYEVPPTWLCLHPSLTLPTPLPLAVSSEPYTYKGKHSGSTRPISHDRVHLKGSKARRDRFGNEVSMRVTRGPKEEGEAGFSRPQKFVKKFPHSRYPSSSDYSSPRSDYPSPPSRYPSPPSRYPSPKSDYSSPKSDYPSPPSRYPSPKSDYPSPSSRYSYPTSRYPSPPSRHSSQSDYPPPPSRFPPRRQNMGFGAKKGAITSEVKLNTIFTEE